MQDLWAEYTGEALSTEERDRGGGTRRRRLSEQAVLAELRAWLLQEYVRPYATSLGATRIFQRCYWIDALSTARASIPPVPSSPSDDTETTRKSRRKAQPRTSALPPDLQPVAALAQYLARLERPITLHGFSLAHKGSARKAQRASAGQPRDDAPAQDVSRGRPALNGAHMDAVPALPQDGGLLSASWQDAAPALLATLGQSAAIFLLDPLKDGLFRYPDLAPLYQRTAPTELLLWFSHKHIETRLLPGLPVGETAAALTNLLRGDRWKRLFAAPAEQSQLRPVIDGLIQFCAESMRPHFLSVQSFSFPMLSGPAHVVNAPYTLLFATRRQDSLACFNDAMCRRVRCLVDESQRGVLNEEWFARQREEQNTATHQELLKETLTLGRAQRPRRWPDMRQHLLLAHFGRHLVREYDEIILTLLTRGEVRCEWQKHAADGETERVPGPNDLLLWR